MVQFKGLVLKDTKEVPFGTMQILVAPNGSEIAIGNLEPGWKWSEHVKPTMITKTELCECSHIGKIDSGRMFIKNQNGEISCLEKGDFFHVVENHDAWVPEEDTENCVIIDYYGAKKLSEDWEKQT